MSATKLYRFPGTLRRRLYPGPEFRLPQPVIRREEAWADPSGRRYYSPELGYPRYRGLPNLGPWPSGELQRGTAGLPAAGEIPPSAPWQPKSLQSPGGYWRWQQASSLGSSAASGNVWRLLESWLRRLTEGAPYFSPSLVEALENLLGGGGYYGTALSAR